MSRFIRMSLVLLLELIVMIAIGVVTFGMGFVLIFLIFTPLSPNLVTMSTFLTCIVTLITWIVGLELIRKPVRRLVMDCSP